ncbi:hypothetical protein B9013_003320 [Klebsiella pneumoniae]|nr:hypothetical protein B9013_003320 [Klebsiella pneumoniae]
MLKKTALSCAASAFTAVPGRDCHQQPSSHNPHNPSTTCQPLPFPRGPQTSLKGKSFFCPTIRTPINYTQQQEPAKE